MAPPSHHWPSRLGPTAGFSGHSPPSLGSEFGPLALAHGSQHGVLIDADCCLYATSFGFLTKFSDEGEVLWQVRLPSKEGSQFAGQPALADGAIFAYTQKGEAMALDAKTGKERWRRVFCKGGCNQDISSVAAGSGAVILSGKDSESDAGLPFHRDVFCLDAATGKEKWKVRMLLGVMCFNPSVIDGMALIQSINGEVACHSVADGEKKWMTKQSGQGSTGGAVMSKVTGLVYSTGNKRGKKDWNMPFGGKGCVRAIDFKSGEVKWTADVKIGDAEMEVNALPAVAPVGPGGKLVVIVAAGANPGTWANPTGDSFPAMLMAIDARDGSQVWQSEVIPYNGVSPGGAPNTPENQNNAAVTWSNPVVCANGRVFVAHQNNAVYEFDGATGEVTHTLKQCPGFTAGVSIGPNMLVVQSARFLYIFRPRFWKGGEILRESEVPFKETGYDHFWPDKVLNHKHTGYCELPATTDLSKPTWVAGDLEKHFARIPGVDFYNRTPVVDSQRNLYVATGQGRVLIVRPDGNLRGYIECGAGISGFCLHKEHLYAFNSASYLVKADIETTDIVLNKRCDWNGTKESFSMTPCPADNVVLIVGIFRMVASQPAEGTHVVALDMDTGEQRWHRMFLTSSIHFTPCLREEARQVLMTDTGGSIWCLEMEHGTSLWESQAIADDCEGSYTTAQCAMGPNEVAYSVWNETPENAPFATWSRGSGSGGRIRSYAADSGDYRWTRSTPLECNATPVVVPTDRGHVVVVAQGAQLRAAPGDYRGPPADGKVAADEDDAAWPRGDAWESCVCGLDGDTGEELWRFDLPVWGQFAARGSSCEDILTAGCFGTPTANAEGKVYFVHWSGTVYCLDAKTGKVLSQGDVGCASKSAVLMLPGTLLVPTGLRVAAYRDEQLEREWLEKARAAGDKRADPRLWDLRRQEVTQADKDLISTVLRVSPEVAAFEKTQSRSLPQPPLRGYGKEAYEARCKRLLDLQKAVQHSPSPDLTVVRGGPAAPSAPAPRRRRWP